MFSYVCTHIQVVGNVSMLIMQGGFGRFSLYELQNNKITFASVIIDAKLPRKAIELTYFMVGSSQMPKNVPGLLSVLY